MDDDSGNTRGDKDAECKIQIYEELPVKNCRIHKVPQHLRSNNQNEDDYYTPKFVSLGPYHHGDPRLSLAESFKPLAFQTLVSGSELAKEILYAHMFNVIDEVRDCYVDLSEGENKIDDKSLTEIMLHDSCFFIYVMKMCSSTSDDDEESDMQNQFFEQLGVSALSYVYRDMYVLENQIPLCVIQLLLGLIYNKEEGSKLLCNFLGEVNFNCWLKSIPEQSFHFLDASRMLAVAEPESKEGLIERLRRQLWGCWKKGLTKRLQQLCGRKEGRTEDFRRHNRQFRSVTDLKAKGIFFRPSSYCLTDIEFESYPVFAVLRLPRFFFTNRSKCYFSNVVAYESSPGDVGVDITCYLSFLKSLVLKPQDVTELRENEILFGTLESDEQIFQVIKEIDTFGIEFTPIFNEVKDKIQKHCNNKARTWIAEFFHTYFRSPWTFIALVVIAVQLSLTIVQTHYAIHPAS